MLPLTRTDPPARLLDHPISSFGEWYTWSREFRTVLTKLRVLIPSLSPPVVTHLYDGKPYDHTYTVTDKLTDGDIHQALVESASSLFQSRIRDRLILVKEIIDDTVTSETIHYLFSYYQFCFGLISGKPDAAMYTPLGDLSETGFPFQLHADLYLQKSLLIVFDKVPLDDSGQTLLISTESFVATIQNLKTMPEEAKVRVRKLLTEDSEEDRFNDFFYFLYEKNAPWSAELSGALTGQQLMVKFLRGEGFLLNDREWLHGRTTTSCAVHEDRLHRLTFNTMEV